MSGTATRPRVRLRRVVFIVLVAVLVGSLLAVANTARGWIRTTPRFDPPVLAGQMVACTAGFYARRGDEVVLTISAHCYNPDVPPTDAAGVVGTYGRKAQTTEGCPAGRFCSPSDFIELVLSPDHIAWGHLNMVDLGPGGYRTFTSDTRPLACSEMHEGDRVELDGRTWYREGRIIQIGPYDFDTDVIFPCMVVTDIEAGIGDSGGAVFVNGQPAGVIAREFGGGRYLGFTPLAEGLANLGLTLCTDPDCGLTPPTPAP